MQCKFKCVRHQPRKLLSDQVEISKYIELFCTVQSCPRESEILSGTTLKRRCQTKERGSMMKEAAAVAWIISNYKGYLQLLRESAKKYSRIGALTIVPLGCEPTLSNIETACTNHFNLQEMECDLLAGERGPSFTDISKITN